MPKITAIRSGVGKAHVGEVLSGNLRYQGTVDVDAEFKVRKGGTGKGAPVPAPGEKTASPAVASPPAGVAGCSARLAGRTGPDSGQPLGTRSKPSGHGRMESHRAEGGSGLGPWFSLAKFFQPFAATLAPGLQSTTRKRRTTMRPSAAMRLMIASTCLISCGGEPGSAGGDRGAASVTSKEEGESCSWTWQCGDGLVCRPTTLNANGEYVPYACQQKARAVETCGSDLGCMVCGEDAHCEDGLICDGPAFDKDSFSNGLLQAGVCVAGSAKTCTIGLQCDEGQVCRPTSGNWDNPNFRCQPQADVNGYCWSSDDCIQGLECQGGSFDSLGLTRTAAGTCG
jgi:hypothetical protein